MKKSRLLGAVCALFLFILTPIASASVVYTYSGNNYNAGVNFGSVFDSSMSVNGTLELSTALAPNLVLSAVTPTSFSFSNGIATFTEASIDLGIFNFATDSSGMITNWDIKLRNPFPSPTLLGDNRDRLDSINSVSNVIDGGVIERCAVVSGTICTAVGFDASGFIQNSPGVWTVSAVPLPQAVWLFGSGLLGLVGMARRKQA